MIGFINKLSASEKKILFITVLFVVGALFDRVFLSPLIERTGLIEEEINQQRINIETDKKILAYKNRINSESKELEKYYVSSVPEDGIVNGEILSLVEKLSAQSNVKLVKSTPSNVEKADELSRYNVDLECYGAFKDVISFMHALNSSDQLLKVDQMKLNPQRGEDEQVKASLKISKLLLEKKASN